MALRALTPAARTGEALPRRAQAARRHDLGADRDDARRGGRVVGLVDVSSVPAGLIPADIPLPF